MNIVLHFSFEGYLTPLEIVVIGARNIPYKHYKTSRSRGKVSFHGLVQDKYRVLFYSASGDETQLLAEAIVKDVA